MRVLEWLHHPSTYVFAILCLALSLGTIESLRDAPVDHTRYGPETSGLIIGGVAFASLLFIRVVLMGIVAFLRRLPDAPTIGSAAKAVQENAKWRGRPH